MRVFFREEVDELACDLNLKLFKTSVKDNKNVDEGKKDQMPSV